jgi:hypothetical protein
MTTRKILTVGLQLASANIEHVDFQSKTSLLDWDIILLKADIKGDFFSARTFEGKPSLSDDQSFKLKECCEHWRREIKQALEADKTIIVFLTELFEVFVASGEKRYSGTGKNRQTTRIVDLYSNYNAIPFSLVPVNTNGSAMKLSALGSEIIAPFWKVVQHISQYKVLLTGADIPGSIVTQKGDKTVGAIYRSKSSSGTLLLMPDIDFYSKTFTTEKNNWTKVANQFAAQFIGATVSLDKMLRSAADFTPEPSWVTSETFPLGPETSLRQRLLDAEQQVEAAQKLKEAIVEELQYAGRLRGLLFEKGRALESAILEALRLLGFDAASYKDTTSEFDVVFESREGRLIGEVEGKDTKAVNVDKLRQLSMNIHEDLQRDEVSVAAKPVLFGNAFRLEPLEKREDPFTEKCCSAAATSSTALVFTPDLFPIAQYLIDQEDEEYARKCRAAMLSAVGRVLFPSPPITLAIKENIAEG